MAFNRIEFVEAIDALIEEAHGNAKSKGWWPAEDLARVPVAEKIALIHSEASEALEDFRDGKMAETFTEKGKPEGLPSELADVVIRVADLAGALGIDLGAAIANKMEFNRTRPHRHGGKAC